MQATISVCVITYNQQHYIRQCLDSILAQVVDEHFEVVVRDDGSKDATPDILGEYALRYPDIVRVLPVERNLGANGNLQATFAASTGEFIAVCEGDDFWTDTRKLQKQLVCARSMPDVDFFTHPATTGTDEVTMMRRWPCQESSHFDIKNVLTGFGQFAPTGSYFFRRSAVTRLPAWFSKAPVGDFFLEVYLTGTKGGFSLAEYMSKYRTASVGSWDDNIRNDKSGAKGVRAYRRIKIYLKKAFADFPQCESEFKKRLEYLNFAIAHQYMKVGKYDQFRRYMEKAGSGVGSIGRAARLLYTMRGYKSVVSGVYYAKRMSLNAKNLLQSWR
jgi:glycosyltransferase involved in cell wall biosynthesis